MGNGNVESKLEKLLGEMGEDFPSEWRELVEFGELLDGVASLLVKENKIIIPKRRTPSLAEVLQYLFDTKGNVEFRVGAKYAGTIMSLLEGSEYFQSNYSEGDDEFEDAEEAYLELRALLKSLFVNGLEE